MHIQDIKVREFLGLSDVDGIIRVMRQRMLLFDAVALGLLRKELIETVGGVAARGILTRFGYTHGWRTAQVLQAEFPAMFQEAHAGAHLHMLFGLVLSEEFRHSDGLHEAPLVEATWVNSYEAEQHLLHLGRAGEPVCWTLAGFASGFESYRQGRETYFIEDRCCGRGDACCHMVGRFREQWGEAIGPHLAFFQASDRDSLLRDLTRRLQVAERHLWRAHLKLETEAPVEAPPSIIVRSRPMRRVLDMARRLARVDSSVVVAGESGVGKEVVARYIHEHSARRKGPFLAVNCGALTETLLESELFGHAKGAFTGADRDHPGLFEAANRGTLFLDEVSEVSPRMQVKLLRALQEREVRRVGENRSRPVDVRIISATNLDLGEAVALSEGPVISHEDMPIDLKRLIPHPMAPQEIHPLRAVERDYILAALRATGGGKEKTAEGLGIGRSTLYRKLAEYGI